LRSHGQTCQRFLSAVQWEIWAGPDMKRWARSRQIRRGSSLEGIKLEMIVDGLAEIESFGLARPQSRVLGCGI
jgi:hypothetical protein